MSKTYICDNCKGEFIKGWSDDEAQAEANKLWSEKDHAKPQAIICDDCFNKLMTHFQ